MKSFRHPASTPNPNFSIVIPNLNGAKYLPACLESILVSISLCPNSKFEIILVDNASTDNSLKVFKSVVKKCSLSLKISNYRLKIIQNTTNLGFAPAVNQGILASFHPWSVLINNDLKLDPQWFPSISKAILEHPAPPLACLAGTVLNYDGQLIESQGLRYYWYGRCLNVGNGRPYQPSHINRLAPHLIWGASAAAIVYHRPTLFQIGLFDSDFFAYEEDVDVAFRLQRFNYHTLYLPQAISYHLGGATSSRFGNFRSRHDARNWWFLILKNYSLPQLIVNLPHLLLERSRNLSGLIKSTFISYGFPRFFLYLPSALVFSYGFIFSPNYWLKLSRHRRFLAQLKVQKPLP